MRGWDEERFELVEPVEHDRRAVLVRERERAIPWSLGTRLLTPWYAMRYLARAAVAVAIGAALSLATACDRTGNAGVLHVDDLPRLSAEPDRRIGDSDDPDIGFSRVTGLDVDDAGTIYILESLAREIRAYSPDGALLRRIGGPGSGPGEFEGAPRFGVMGDTVWAVENWAGRITLFDRDGTVLSTGRTEGVTVPLPSGFGSVLPRFMRPDGTFMGHFGRLRSRRPDEPETGVRPTASIPWPFVLFDAGGAVTDTIGWAARPPPRIWRPPSEQPPEHGMIEVGERRLMVPRPPTTLPWWLQETDGYVLVETPLAETAEDGVLTVTRIGLAGDTVYRQPLHYSPAPYTSEDLDSIAALAARGEPGGMVPYIPDQGPPSDWEVIARRFRDAMEFPTFQLPIEYPWLAQDGGVWLRRTDEGTAEAVGWILLDPRGRPRGRLELPPDLRILWNRGDTFWAAEPDELDVPWVVRFRIRSD